LRSGRALTATSAQQLISAPPAWRCRPVRARRTRTTSWRYHAARRRVLASCIAPCDTVRRAANQWSHFAPCYPLPGAASRAI